MITSPSNPKIKLVRALQSQRHAREKEGLFVVEGVRLASEAAAAGVPTRLVLHTDHLDPRGRAVTNRLARLGASVEVVNEAVMRACTDTDAPPGLLAIVAQASLPMPSPLTFALVLDRVADPGNLGTMLRTALASGVQAVWLAPGTVDAFNPKVVRAAMGAHFRLPVAAANWDELRSLLNGLETWLAEAQGGTLYHAVDWSRPCALIVGGEAEGASDAGRQLAAGRVSIPMVGPAESLNAAVAAGIIVFEAARQRRVPGSR